MQASAPPALSVPSVSLSQINIDNDVQNDTKKFLQDHKFPAGLIEVFIENLKKIPIRYFIIDDSGSMSASDGHKLVNVRGKDKFVPCTRFDELSLSIRFHAELAFIARAPSEFRFLNYGSPVTIGFGDKEEDRARLDTVLAMLHSSPNGGTPLCHHIREITKDIQLKKDAFRSTHQVAAVIIASDGEASDGSIVEAMKPLQTLPVWTVIRKSHALPLSLPFGL